ncbi:anaerobic glycerol-3-phosphate dehydrogenase subunit C [Desulfosporosinus nitroreducens]|uniref:anaerobic glycerol-3-phosphate dehydrogenase subunit C n=1 Tax=Desulfosporosinus nitroreducens TaxID=2018668 RepID=UPI00207C9A3D|nr:anaerobic glycerol-3-phosphate dehydrogenase subunit C [Desulfosporosinus nitroreducens]MCO1601577.1 anaerobic glycerol-3-phosphate dehydrogenase subunit C [Desulfosporosinus nitroreducens]
MDSRDELAARLDACQKCNMCTAQCPVAKVNPRFIGPKGLGPDMERFRRGQINLDETMLDDCSNCKTCELTCPSGVKITEMILGARRAASKARHKNTMGLRLGLRGYILGRNEYLGKLGVIWPTLTNQVLKIKLVRLALDKTLSISKNGPLPAYGKPLKIQPDKVGIGTNTNKQVVYFPGCYTRFNEGDTGRILIRLLEHLGYKTTVPDFHCCGLPLEANGQFGKADKNGRYNLELMRPYLEAGIPVITSCTSCGLTLKEDYPKLETSSAQLIGAQAYDLFEFLWQLHEKGELPLDFQEVRASYGYHPPCHLKAQGIGTPALRILGLIPGVKIRNLDAGCCGLSGSYGFKAEKYKKAMKIGSSLFEAINVGSQHGDFQSMTTECGVCKVQIVHGTGIPTEHPVHILAKAYRLID